MPETEKMLDTTAYISIASLEAQRQILSLLVQDYSYIGLKIYIPELIRYKYSAARKRAVANPFPDKINNCEKKFQMNN